MVQEALEAARSELEALRARQAVLEREIADAEGVLRRDGLDQALPETMTLHEALVRVLQQQPDAALSARELADAVNAQGLYRRRDGSPVAANQIQARINNYRALFEKDGAGIRLRKEPAVLSDARTDLAIFRDDDAGFFNWLSDHPDGFFVNTERNPKPTYLVLHKPGCPHFTGGPHLRWTKEYVKVCARDKGKLEAWAADSVGGEVTLCRSCFG